MLTPAGKVGLASGSQLPLVMTMPGSDERPTGTTTPLGFFRRCRWLSLFGILTRLCSRVCNQRSARPHREDGVPSSDARWWAALRRALKLKVSVLIHTITPS